MITPDATALLFKSFPLPAYNESRSRQAQESAFQVHRILYYKVAGSEVVSTSINTHVFLFQVFADGFNNSVAMDGFMAEIRKIPPVTRFLCASSLAVNIPVLMNIVSAYKVVFILNRVLRRFEVCNPLKPCSRVH